MCIRDSNDAVLMLISGNLHTKRSEISIKTCSTPTSLSFKGQATKHTTVKWSILYTDYAVVSGEFFHLFLHNLCAHQLVQKLKKKNRLVTIIYSTCFASALAEKQTIS